MTEDDLYRRSAGLVLAEAESVIAGYDHLTGDREEVQKALDRKATAKRLIELLPVADDGKPFDAWSFLRDVVSRASLLAGEAERGGWGYEQLSAKIDKIARDYADRLKPHLREKQ